MVIESRLIWEEIRLIEKRLREVRAQLKSLEEQEGQPSVPPLMKLRGIWKGANFTEEEIAAAKISLRDLPE